MRLNLLSQIWQKGNQSWQILKLTKFRYYRASQIEGRAINFKINHRTVKLRGQAIWSMIKEIIILDVYHLKTQQNPKVIFDIGANVGIFSLYAATLFPECKIYAFEPSIENFELLKENTREFSNIYCINLAMANYDGIASLRGGKDRTSYSITYSTSTALKTLQKCNTTTLETFLAETSLHYIDILKLDCEGAEYDIILSPLDKIKQIVGEYHVIETKKTEDLRNLLIQKGFSFNQWKEFPTKNAGLFWAVNEQYYD